MSEADAGRRGSGAIRRENGNAAAIGAADWLHLAAAPTFAIMALLTAVLGGGSLDALCSKCVTAERNGPDVLADERLPFGALAEADRQPAKRSLPVLIRREMHERQVLPCLTFNGDAPTRRVQRRPGPAAPEREVAMNAVSNEGSLRGRVAVVAGATRGAGRGIAAALGEAGATVICTGRSTARADASTRSDYDRPETIEETAELVTNLGGVGIPIAVDHLEPAQVAALAERIRGEYGRIDVLVNDIWGAERLKGGPADWNKPIWKLDLQKGLRILRLGIETHLVTSHYLLPLLVAQPGGLLVEVTDGTADYNESHYRISVFYDLVKQSVNRLAFSQGHELEPYMAAAVAITPGWLRSEMMLENFGVTEANWRDALDDRAGGQPKAPPDFALSESPRYIGRAVAALATDPDRKQWNKKSLSSGELARHYGFTDIDGSRPDIWRYMTEVRETGRVANLGDYR